MNIVSSHNAWVGSEEAFNTFRQIILLYAGWSPEVPCCKDILFVLAMMRPEMEWSVDWRYCGGVADKLLDAYPQVKEDLTDTEASWVIEATTKFIEGLMKAYEEERDLEFKV